MAPEPSTEAAESVVARVLESARYRHVAPDLVRRIAREMLAGGLRPGDAVKATQRRLHQVAGAYLVGGGIRYARWLATLREARAEGEEAFRQACRAMMRLHASTAERLPILETFYTRVLGEFGPVRSVVDVACGLGPLGIPWMPLAEGATYAAYDAYTDLAAFLEEFLPLAGVVGRAEARDVVGRPPEEEAEVALVLKFVTNAEQLEEGSTLRLLGALGARRLVVTFPVRSLGGRGRGMAANYAERFEAVAATQPWRVERLTFTSELAYVVEKTGAD